MQDTDTAAHNSHRPPRLWRVGAAGLAAAVLVVAGANTNIQHKPPAVLACLALRCRVAGVLVSVAFRALLAVCVAFRALLVCWWYNYTSRARCA